MFNIGELELLLEFAKIFLFGLMTPKLGENSKEKSIAMKEIMTKIKKYLTDCDEEKIFKQEDFEEDIFDTDNNDEADTREGRTMTYRRSQDAPRANNGPIENHFMQKKRDAREDGLKIGSFGKIQCGRYVQHLSEISDTTIKGITYDIPARSRVGRNQKTPT